MRKNVLIQQLQDGYTVQWRPKGNSMTPKIKSGELVTVEPCKLEDVKKGDVVYCKVNGRVYLHLAKKVGDDGRILIANNHGHDNGWSRTIYGKLTKVEE